MLPGPMSLDLSYGRVRTWRKQHESMDPLCLVVVEWCGRDFLGTMFLGPVKHGLNAPCDETKISFKMVSWIRIGKGGRTQY